ncbi:hypothetical protein EDD86DRAFT_217252 [Gorgonomyces haynaldii]|nr:hypothetical protein EDD86DRAFT_217252 [Gorgonomyces haynaldii]
MIPLLLNAVAAQVGFTKTGLVVQAPSTCSSFGDGLVKQQGCIACFDGFETAVSMTSNVWSSTGDVVLRAQGTFQRCKKIPAICAWNPFASPQIKQQRHEYVFVDPQTKASVPVGCQQNGDINLTDLYLVKSNVTGFVPYIVQTDNLDCKDMPCTKVSLYDYQRSRTVEVGRLVNSDAKDCTPTGACYVLRVIPSPSGKLLAVVLLDDNNQKALVNKGTWEDYPAHHQVTFLEAQPLLQGKVVKRGTQNITIPAGQFLYAMSFKWSPKEDWLGLVGGGITQTATNFFVDNIQSPIFGSCDSPLKTCDCASAATASANYRIGDGLWADDMTSFDKLNAYNCGNTL